MKYQVTHTTAYRYEDEISVGHHLLRLTPLNRGRQRCLEHTLSFAPEPKTRSRRQDYFGNEVVFVALEGAHAEFRVTARSRVEVGPAPLFDPPATPAWETVRERFRRDSEHPYHEAVEYCFNSPLILRRPEYASFAKKSFVPGRPLREAVLDLTHRIHTEFEFDPRATTAATPVLEVLKQRRGVCQDFAHFEIACLRSLGLPARYVSGYLETRPPAGQPKLLGADASHAWISTFCPGHGWIDIDPTNDLLPSDRHVTLGYGRDFSDVSPVRGVIVGGGEHRLEVAVDVVPLAGGDALAGAAART